MDRAPISPSDVLSMMLTSLIFLLWNMVIKTWVHDKQSEFNSYRHLWGMSFYVYWFGNFLTSCGFIIVSISLVCISAMIFYIGSLNIFLGFMAIIPALLIAGICIFNINFIVSLLFNDPDNALELTTTCNLMSIALHIMHNEIHYRGHHAKLPFDTIFRDYCLLSPLFTVAQIIKKSLRIADMNNICSDKLMYTISVEVENCTIVPDCCCKYKTQYINVRPGRFIIIKYI